MVFRVLSIDMDGCLFNKSYRNSDKTSVLRHNESFIRVIKARKDEYTRSFVFLGSNRQSFYSDFSNKLKNKTASCFPVIKNLAKALAAEFIPFLMSDIFGDLDDGVSFERAINQKNHDSPHADWKHDNSKLTILYAQIHKIVKENPNEECVFEFFDDQGLKEEPDLLEWLSEFFNTYPEMLPQKCTLRLHHYNGGAITLISSIPGTGFVDANYRQTVKDMIHLAADHVFSDKDNQKVNIVANHVQPQLLKNRIPFEESTNLVNSPVTNSNNSIKENELGFFAKKVNSSNGFSDNNSNNNAVI